MNPIYQPISSQEVAEYVKSNRKLVRCQTFSDWPNYFVLKYTSEAFWAGAWNKILVECRGTVVDKDFNPVARAFTKVFNHLENKDATYDENDAMVVERKVNGFMACATYLKNEDRVLVSTTGSLDSPFTKLATEHLQQYFNVFKTCPGYTFAFEICDPEDEHIVPEKPGAYLIGMRESVYWDTPARFVGPDGMDMFASDHGIMRPEWSVMSFGDALKAVKEVEHEGFCVYPNNNPLADPGIKLKSPYYKITKFLGRMKPERLDKMINDPRSMYKEVDEEYYPLVEEMIKNREQFVVALPEQRIKMIRTILSR